MTKTERMFMVNPKCCERGTVSENFNMMIGINSQICNFIIANNLNDAISKQGQNMTETDIYFSESFIYSNREKFYYKSTISKDEKEKFGCKEHLVEKQYFCISLDIYI